MPILERRKEKGKMRFEVSCRPCGHVFESGPNPNLWRIAKAKYKLSPEQVRQMQSTTLTRFVQQGTVPKIEDAGAVLFFDGKLVAHRVKNKKAT